MAQAGFVAGVQTTHCGPKSSTLNHWHEQVKTIEPRKSGKKWQFKCKYCNKCVSLMFQTLQHELTMFWQMLFPKMFSWCWHFQGQETQTSNWKLDDSFKLPQDGNQSWGTGCFCFYLYSARSLYWCSSTWIHQGKHGCHGQLPSCWQVEPKDRTLKVRLLKVVCSMASWGGSCFHHRWSTRVQ